MATKKKSAPTLVKLEPETIGERFHRAFRYGRRTFGYTYRTLALHVAQVHGVSDATISRWQELSVYDAATLPLSTRKSMFYCLLALGVDPAEFDLAASDLGIHPDIEKTARDLLIPSSRCYAESAA
jgi:hypothetical protein